MPSRDHYKAIIIGSGQGGNPLATALANAKWRTALIEREHIGGTCINEGCTPTKTMVASARVAYLARRGSDYGVHGTEKITIDMEKIRERKRAIVDKFRDSTQRRLEKTPHLDVLFGQANFTGPKSIVIQMKDGSLRTITADYIFINAGCRPATPDLPGINDVGYLDSTSIMEVDEVPEHLIVLGGGYEGLEFGQMFRRFGSRVTIIQSGNQLLAREDPDVANAIEDIFKQDGIDVHLNSRALAVSRSGAQIEVTINSPKSKGTHKLNGSHLLVATGRRPNTDWLNLSAANIATDDHRYIKVNPRLQTSVKNVYALGDIKGGPAFTHISYDDYRILRDNLLKKGNRTTTNRMVPYTVFIDPQFGSVGLNETAAREQKRKVRVAKMDMYYVARALEVDESRGFMKALVDPKTNRILGAQILGLEGGEVMTMLQIAMQGKLPYTALQNATFAHPLLAEALNNLFNHFTS